MKFGSPTSALTLESPLNLLGVRANYTSNEAELHLDLLKKLAHDYQPITPLRIDYSKASIPDYTGCCTVIPDNVLSPSECQTIMELAEESAIPDDQ